MKNLPNGLKVSLGVIAAILVWGLYLVISDRPLSNQAALDLRLGQIATWKPVTPAINDPIVAETVLFIDSYAAWFGDDPQPPAKLMPDLKNFVLDLHQVYAAKCRSHGVKMPPPGDIWQLNDQAYQDRMAPVVSYLRDHGWAAGFTRPHVELDEHKQPKIVSQMFLGRVKLRTDGTLTDSSNKERDYTIDLVSEDGLVTTAQFTTLSATEGLYSCHFLGAHERVFSLIQRQSTGRPDKDHDSILWKMEWDDDYKQLGDSSGFYAQVMTDLVGFSVFREMQRMKDHRLIAKARTIKLTPKRREDIFAYIEARGLLRATSDSGVPVYGLERMTSGSGDSDPYRSTGAILASVYLGNVSVSSMNDPSVTREEMQVQAHSGLRHTDRIYAEVYQRMGKIEDIFSYQPVGGDAIKLK